MDVTVEPRRSRSNTEPTRQRFRRRYETLTCLVQTPEQFGNSDKVRAIGVLVVKPWWFHGCVTINEREVQRSLSTSPSASRLLRAAAVGAECGWNSERPAEPVMNGGRLFATQKCTFTRS